MKCDEGRPACRRCVSTGRTCDGYGIWGGGNQVRSTHQHPIKEPGVVLQLQPSLSTLPANTNRQNEYLEWFRLRTVTKLPGTFNSRFWNLLLLQSSIAEPAVLHSILALSSIHKSGVANVGNLKRIDSIPDREEQFALKEYTKAITHLQPHFLAQDKTSSKIALITCLVFVYLELLRGHFQAAETHLHNGLQILTLLQLISYEKPGGIFCWKNPHGSTDESIVEAFSRLHLQFELFRHGYQHSCIVLQETLPATPITEFRAFNDAWLQLEKLFNKMFYINHHSRKPISPDTKFSRQPHLFSAHQDDIRSQLVEWQHMLDAFVKDSKRERSTDQDMTDDKRYHTICLYHTLAIIMAETCLQPGNEMLYDQHVEKFILMISQAPKLWSLALKKIPINALPTTSIDMARSIIDIGWIPPLFYTAIKCRVHRIRLQAIRLLESSSHREGIWDSRIAVCIARKVMELEEGDFYRDAATSDNFPLMSFPRTEDLSLPTLPDSRRLREVEISLVGAPMDRILLFCKENRDGHDERILKAEYSVHSQEWKDMN